ncbi:Maf family nucleotide pyrophosphatase [Herbiconiux moechotypicola]|uniref:Nucleoside triphosphate pyrophosphatase n=1 Tax=Herbiconiux moechotypicola TaxID=637393 RepID=A0ABN3DVI0_9MICO|nr:nucleoside triphosphate pyrophosphatase [Herbiconiux moechotypicola]MCS5730971.1 Maf family nucleotide pyrophosphatase [Herbiconiux moechotypicola]
MRLYLASTSPARLTLLRQIGIEPVVLPSEVDEDAAVREAEAQRGPLGPGEMVQLLAEAKAEAVAAAIAAGAYGAPGCAPDGSLVDGFVLGGDSAFELDGVTYGKPHRPEVARERWLAQRGRSGTLHSGHCLIDHRGGERRGAAGRTDQAGLSFAEDISDAEIDAYVASGEPLLVAGAFTIDGLAAPFIRSVSGAPSAVVGLSLPVVRDLLKGFGIDWTSLWNRPPL